MSPSSTNPPFFQFENLQAFPELFHGIFTRRGGASQAPWDTFNIGHGVGDCHSAVQTNRRRMLQATRLNSLFFVSQVHGQDVYLLKTPPSDGAEAVQADALITARRGIGLVIQVADCQAVLLYDPVRQIVANIHAGWRGSVAQIIGRTIARMQEEYLCRPENLFAAIGPSLGPCCAEFVNYRRELPPDFWPYRISQNMFNFWDISRDQLRAAGVLPGHIEYSQICTVCQKEWYFSYRREQITGRQGAVIGLIEPTSVGI